MTRLFAAAALLLVVEAAHAQVPEDAIAMFMFGQVDPRDVQSRDLSGIGKAPVPISIVQIGQCKYRISDLKTFEEIDFNKVAEIRHTISEDLRDKIEATLETALGDKARPTRKVVLVQVMGTKDAICGPTECTAKRAFRFDDTDQIDRAKIAAHFFRINVCNGRKF